MEKETVFSPAIEYYGEVKMNKLDTDISTWETLEE